MAEFPAPATPPPPKVPEGWKAQWNTEYSEWFYVNLYTKQSQWEKPTEPKYPPSDSTADALPGPPPGYTDGDNSHPAEKSSYLATNNPYSFSQLGPSSQDIAEDERLARQLQAEENARAQAAGASHTNEPNRQYGQQQGPPANYDQQELPPREHKKGALSGLLGKLSGKHSSSHQPQHWQHGYPQQGYGGYPPHPHTGGHPHHGYEGGYGGSSHLPYGAPPRRHGGAGMGAAGGAALGLGGGLVGGALLADAVDGEDYGEYDSGGDFAGDGGGGGDFGGF